MKNQGPIPACILIILILTTSAANAVNISGVINTYTAVSAIDYVNNNVTVSSTVGFSVNSKVILIQMNGATVDSSNSSSFGDILNYN
ncbi:MAG: hypothetical protein IH946_07065, partial [Bacteroidetes bacterium]|nr:hypothetical protein [Bacteroidota bacterium]